MWYIRHVNPPWIPPFFSLFIFLSYTQLQCTSPIIHHALMVLQTQCQSCYTVETIPLICGAT